MAIVSANRVERAKNDETNGVGAYYFWDSGVEDDVLNNDYWGKTGHCGCSVFSLKTRRIDFSAGNHLLRVDCLI